MQEFDAATIEEVFSDGLLNVMAAPEFAQSEKLRRVFAALENRVVARRARRQRRRRRGACSVFIGEENAAADMHEVRWSWRRTGGPATRSAWSACSGQRACRTRRRSGPSASSPA